MKMTTEQKADRFDQDQKYLCALRDQPFQLFKVCGNRWREVLPSMCAPHPDGEEDTFFAIVQGRPHPAKLVRDGRSTNWFPGGDDGTTSCYFKIVVDLNGIDLVIGHCEYEEY